MDDDQGRNLLEGAGIAHGDSDIRRDGSLPHSPETGGRGCCYWYFSQRRLVAHPLLLVWGHRRRVQFGGEVVVSLVPIL